MHAWVTLWFMLRANAGSEFLRDRLHQGVNSAGCLATASLAPTANAQTARLQDSARKQAAIETKQQYVGPSVPDATKTCSFTRLTTKVAIRRLVFFMANFLPESSVQQKDRK